MNKEQENTSTLFDEKINQERNLILLNDDVNTFQAVISALIEVCHHTPEQAETCAWITHYKGKCTVKSGSYDVLKPYHQGLLDRHLSANIQ